MNFLIIGLLLLVAQQLYAAVDPNKALFDYVTIEITEKEENYITMLPKNISHDFLVSFVFPKVSWNSEFQNPDSDDYHCFANKLRRRLRNVYYKDEKNYEQDYKDAKIVRMRNDTYTTADFDLHFIKTLLWPAWNESLVTNLFPAQQQGLAQLYKYPQINSSRDPFVNYTKFEIEWFGVIENEKNMFSSEGAFAYFGFYNITPPPPTYTGPEYTSTLNLTLYGLLGFNIFVIVVALLFWAINCNRQKLLLSYWFKEELTNPDEREITPGDI